MEWELVKTASAKRGDDAEVSSYSCKGSDSSNALTETAGEDCGERWKSTWNLSLSSNKKPLADKVETCAFRIKQSHLRQHTVLHHLLASLSLPPKTRVTRVTHSHLREKQCDSNAVLLLKPLRVLLKLDESGLYDTLGESREARSR